MDRMLPSQGASMTTNLQLDTTPLIPPQVPQRSSETRSIDSTINLLDSLLSFYHQERMWVYRTRASLEMVLEAAPSTSSGSVESSVETDSALGDETASAMATRMMGAVKAEPMSPTSLNNTLWMRRKKGFKLKLEGISTRAKRRRTNQGQEAPSTPGVQMLELFENMMKDRMESCERVSKLVKESSNMTADL